MKNLGKSSLSWILISSMLITTIITSCSNTRQTDNTSTNKDPSQCNGDLSNMAHMTDILSNALTLGLEQPSIDVREFLDTARSDKLFKTSEALTKASAKQFNIDETLLFNTVETFKYINCPTSDIYKQYNKDDVLIDEENYEENYEENLVSIDSSVCQPNLNNPGEMSDIISNALTLGLKQPETKVRAFLETASIENVFQTGNELAHASANEFNIDETLLFETIETFTLINCPDSDIHKHYQSEHATDKQTSEGSVCRPNLNNPGEMSDIISNALTLGLKQPETKVRDFLETAYIENIYQTGDELAQASAKKFNIDEALLFKTIDTFKYINCPDNYKYDRIEEVVAFNSACHTNLNNPGKMSDILSNALTLGLKQPENEVREFLDNAYTQNNYKTGQALALATSDFFNVEKALLFDMIEKYKYINCPHQEHTSINIHQKINNQSCDVDLNQVNIMSDIVSNALVRGLDKEESSVRQYLELAYSNNTFKTGYDLASALAIEFNVKKQTLFEMINSYKYINCWDNSNSLSGDSNMSEFTQKVLTHVVLHELGHAIISEFNLPVLGDEEALADSFATHFLVSKLPDSALPILNARIQSLLIEAKAESKVNSSAQRAFQIAALAIGYDKQAYASLGTLVNMNSTHINKAIKYGSNTHRSWDNILSSIIKAENTETNITIHTQYSLFSKALHQSKLDQLYFDIYQLFDWPQKVTLHFSGGEGNAQWNQSERKVTVFDQYIYRFNNQGRLF